jgi:translation initiation factor IF-1
VPGFGELRWEKGGKEVREALVGDKVDMVCEVKDINNGEKVKLRVWEHDEDNEHDLVAELGGEVENGQVRKGWEVVYTSDEDDGSTSAKELKEKGYTLPEYHFVAEYGDVKSEPGPVLEVRGWAELALEDYQSKEPLANKRYTIFLENGEKVEGITDGKGNINKTGMPISDRFIMIHEE